MERLRFTHWTEHAVSRKEDGPRPLCFSILRHRVATGWLLLDPRGLWLLTVSQHISGGPASADVPQTTLKLDSHSKTGKRQ